MEGGEEGIKEGKGGGRIGGWVGEVYTREDKKIKTSEIDL